MKFSDFQSSHLDSCGFSHIDDDGVDTNSSSIPNIPGEKQELLIIMLNSPLILQNLYIYHITN